jgi:hypothetical protein
MKGIEQWMWIAIGIIAGLVVFVFAYQQIAGIVKSSAEQKSIEQFNEIGSIVDNLCWSSDQNKREYVVHLGETIEGIYSVSDKYEEYKGTNLTNKLLSEDYSYGNYLCIKIKDKRTACKKLECNANMPFIGAVPEKFSLSALVGKLTGKGKTFDYYLNFQKDGKDVRIFIGNECRMPVSEFNPLIKCNGKNTVVLMNNSLIIGDSTSFVECCNVISKPFENLMNNTASYFGGSKILIIWEDPQANPDTNEKSRIINSIKTAGFTISNMQHTTPFSYDNIKQYDQIWFIRPGICENSKMKQYCNYKWVDSEFVDIKNYSKIGKIVLITDYSSLVPKSTGDRIVKSINQNVTISKNCFCGCDGENIKAEKVAEHEITDDIGNFIVRASAAIELNCNK